MRRIRTVTLVATLLAASAAWGGTSDLVGTWEFRLGEITQLVRLGADGSIVINEHLTDIKDLVKVGTYAVDGDSLRLTSHAVYYVEADGSLTPIAPDPEEALKIVSITADQLVLFAPADNLLLTYARSDRAMIVPEGTTTTAVNLQSWGAVKGRD